MISKHKDFLNMKIIYISLAAIAVLGFIVYSNSLDAKFIWDDHYLVKNNTHIKNPSRVLDLFKTDIAAGVGREARSYRPLQMLTYMLDYSIWKLDVRGYHLTNILLHILAALSIYWLINILYDNRLLSLFTSMLFVAHPMHTEAVTYISGRADPLAGIFLILCLIFYIKYINSNRKIFLILTLLSTSFALLSRENSIIIPVLLILYHYSFNKRLSLRGLLSVTAVVLLYIIIRATALKHLLLHMLDSSSTLLQRIPGFFVALTNYLKIMFLPLGLHMEYGDKLFRLTEPKALLGIAILAVLLIYLFRKARSKGLIWFSLSWFFVSLSPSANLYPITAYMAEHWLYIPSIGFFLILAGSFDKLYKREGFKPYAVVIMAAVLIAYSFLTIKQNQHWKEPIAFYERTLKYAPGSYRVYNDLGLAYYDEGRAEEAISLYKKALKLKPDFVDAYNNLGIAYKSVGREKEAAALYKKAIEIKPDYAVAYYNLGNISYDKGSKNEAVSLYEKAIEINPHHARVYYNLGNALRDIGRIEDAETAYKNAIKADPGYAYPYNNLGIIYYDMGKKEEAISLYKKAIALDPDYVDGYNNLGMAYYDIGKPEEAHSLFRKAIGLNPEYALPYYNLAILHYYRKEFKEAIKYCDKAIELGHKVSFEFLKALEAYKEE
ncbi:MAG: tetratricopeptide repeat protein [Candidatus Omnitrophota bacterium]